MGEGKFQLILKVVVKHKKNALPLTTKAHQSIPCHYLKCHECEEKLYMIDVSPGSSVTADVLIETYISRIKQDFSVIKYNYGTLEEFKKLNH